MRVFKFGGASIKDAFALLNMASIIKQCGLSNQLLVVVSAMGKTTNALEMLLKNFQEGGNYSQNIADIHQYHEHILQDIFWDKDHQVYQDLRQCMAEIQQKLDAHVPNTSPNQLYDSLVGMGEIISSKIVVAVLQEQKIEAVWFDAREVIHTNDMWREAQVDWKMTKNKIRKEIMPLLADKILLTQGFIGQTTKGRATTLGREGSDYSAAIFANCLDASDQTIWKDVLGVLNADPKRVPDAQLFSQLSYHEASEMTYYGASVIHPKTISPLKEKNIPLYVKSFLQPQKAGTCISNVQARKFIPAIMHKDAQILLHWKGKNFNFLKESEISKILDACAEANVPIYLLQRTAFGLGICSDNRTEKIAKLIQLTEANFEISFEENVALLTVKDGSETDVKPLLEHSKVLWEVKQEGLYQVVFCE